MQHPSSFTTGYSHETNSTSYTPSCLYAPLLMINRSLDNVLLFVKTWIGAGIMILDRDLKSTGYSSWTTQNTQQKVYCHLWECFRNTNYDLVKNDLTMMLN